jgi:hypothetical protein
MELTRPRYISLDECAKALALVLTDGIRLVLFRVRNAADHE